MQRFLVPFGIEFFFQHSGQEETKVTGKVGDAFGHKDGISTLYSSLWSWKTVRLSYYINWKAPVCNMHIHIYDVCIYICICMQLQIYPWKPTARELKSWEAKNLCFLTR